MEYSDEFNAKIKSVINDLRANGITVEKIDLDNEVFLLTYKGRSMHLPVKAIKEFSKEVIIYTVADTLTTV